MRFASRDGRLISVRDGAVLDVEAHSQGPTPSDVNLALRRLDELKDWAGHGAQASQPARAGAAKLLEETGGAGS